MALEIINIVFTSIINFFCWILGKDPLSYDIQLNFLKPTTVIITSQCVIQ